MKRNIKRNWNLKKTTKQAKEQEKLVQTMEKSVKVHVRRLQKKVKLLKTMRKVITMLCLLLQKIIAQKIKLL